MKKRVTGIILLIAAIAAASIIAFALGIDPPASNIMGAFAAVVFLVIAARIIKVSDGIFFSALVFIFLASPMGSILNLYRSFGPYDKFVHFISGILLAVFGMTVIQRLMKKCITAERYPFMVPMIFFACMFSSGAAGIWEIFEFVTDRLAGGGMQRGMVDTVTDMIAGNTGALVYGIWAYFHYIKAKKKLH